MSVYVDKYKWTGQTTPRVTNSIKGQTFTPTERKSVWQFYEVHFGRTLNKGETVDTDLTFDFEDPQHSFVPFISTNIEEPTRQLKLALRVPLALGVTEVICETSSCIGARVPFQTETKQLDRDGYVEWPVPQPKMHHYYELRWAKPVSAAGVPEQQKIML